MSMIAFALFLQLLAPSHGCNADLQSHVYKPQRLVTLKGCVSVTGVITWRHYERDGDLHLRLRLDRRHKLGQSILLEVICVGPITQSNAIEACKDFKNEVVLPKLGDRIRVTGMHVLDRKHGGIQEIHPVSSITILNGR